MDRLLNRDIVLQVIAVLLAGALWLQATAVQNPVDRFTFDGVPVNTAEIPAGLTVIGAPRPAKVNISVRCRRRVAERLTVKDFTASVSLEGERVGSHEHPVEIAGPKGVDVIEISPAAVTVSLDTVTAAKVPVTVRYVNQSPNGHLAGEPRAVPTEVAVEGPTATVARVTAASARVDISQLRQDTTETVTLMAVDANDLEVNEVQLVPAEVAVDVPVVVLATAESVEVEPVLTGSPAEGYAVLRTVCNPARVAVRPQPGFSIDFDRLVTTPVDIAGSTADVRVTVGLVLDPTAALAFPGQVEVTVEIGAIRLLTGIPVVVRGVLQGYQTAIRPAKVDLIVHGPKNLLDRLALGDVAAWVSAEERAAGSFTVSVNVDFPAWAEDRLEVASLTPAEVTLELTR